MIASASDDCTIRVWDLRATTQNIKERERKIPSPRKLVGHSGYVQCVSFSSDGRLLVSGGDNSSLLLWDLTSKALAADQHASDPDAHSESFLKKLKTREDVFGVIFYDGDERIISSGHCGLRIWNVESEECLRTIPTIGLCYTLRVDLKHPSWVLTEYGAWPLSSDAYRSNDSPVLPPSWAPWRFNPKRAWITFKDKNIIFVPYRYQPREARSSAVLANKVAIGSRRGVVLLFKFAEEGDPTWGTIF
jgi:WD40 repeat protein